MAWMGTQAALQRENILKTLGESRDLLQAFGVARLSLFGSFARDEGRAESDVDLLAEFNRPIGLFEFARLQRRLGELLGHRVDLVTPAALKPQLRDRILREAVIAA
jgi:predicted nucleotidyltransferase